jgi:hypothetical protein
MNIRDIMQRIKWDKNASDVTKKGTVRRIQSMANAIEAQFPEVRYCNQIKLKHMTYIKRAWFDNEGFAVTTMADYTRAMRLMIRAMGKERDWFGRLDLNQCQQRGGRPVSSRVTKTKSRNTRRK